ncbi:AbrB/MazE/SpoVT family DNA-binding domain-containing protein [Devosia nitrariae]|uniref:AbrB family transcriptional regulator n=1 Tax=Devosia nitrariae TaxID=2071872 RepID=A0ABQ5W5R6_9HYPH|nr:AbrB/MazE/SpoVT family DNA-binding domain-containing protein [Devosia nitrariae]GLQ55222.1 AbrB family transcriptional regulator [Devosia nitrariae]
MGTRMTVKGQVTIPKSMRDRYGMRPGNMVEFKSTAAGILVVPADGKRLESRLRKYLGHAGPGLSTDEIMALTRGDE